MKMKCNLYMEFHCLGTVSLQHWSNFFDTACFYGGCAQHLLYLSCYLIYFYLYFWLLGFDTSILPICKDSLGWMFNRLDTNYDLLLDQSELGSIYLDKNEPCTRAFFNSCDTYKDSLISNNEWCYCFQRQQGKRWKQPAYLYDWSYCSTASFL